MRRKPLFSFDQPHALVDDRDRGVEAVDRVPPRSPPGVPMEWSLKKKARECVVEPQVRRSFDAVVCARNPLQAGALSRIQRFFGQWIQGSTACARRNHWWRLHSFSCRRAAPVPGRAGDRQHIDNSSAMVLSFS